MKVNLDHGAAGGGSRPLVNPSQGVDVCVVQDICQGAVPHKSQAIGVSPCA